MEGIAAAFGVNWKLLFIQIVNFGILLFILQKFLYKPLLAMIDRRKTQIEKGIENALDAEIKLSEARAKADALVTEAKEKGLLSIESAKDRARVAGESIIKKAEEEKTRQLSQARAEGERIKEKALADSSDEIIKLSILAAGKVLREKA